jgi:transposase
MTQAEQLKQDVREGRITADRLVDLVEKLQQELQETRRRIQELERQLGAAPTVKVAEPYSLQAEEQRQQARGKVKRKPQSTRRRGRISTAEKLAQAKRTETVFPPGIAPGACRWSHSRLVWRLEQGQAVLVAYEVFRGPRNQYGQIPGTLGRSEFGLEIVLAIAYQVYVLGLSFDKVCLLLNFFQHLPLRKAQADALLQQLARHWEHEFEVLATLLAHSLVVHADETSWSLNSAWAFLSEKARLLFFGVPKDAATLEKILDPATFAGLLISDDAAVYANFTQSQKCWAHLLRKAIKLTLQEPDNAEYRQLADRLLAIYRAARRVQRDRRLSAAGRARKVAALDDELLDLCGPVWFAHLPRLEGPDDDYRLLCNEVMRLMVAQELFPFVTTPPVASPCGTVTPVAGTNHEAERTLRSVAQARQTGRASKTLRGARRRTIIVSVLESLRQYLPTFTLASVLAEIRRWSATGCSCFTQLLVKLKLNLPTVSVLDQVLPAPGG